MEIAPPIYSLIKASHIDCVSGLDFSLRATLPPTLPGYSQNLILDIYAHEQHTHPEGHLGWWEIPLADHSPVTMDFSLRERPQVLFNGQEPRTFWWNQDFDLAELRTLHVHVVLRDDMTTAIRHQNDLLLFRDQARLDRWLASNKALASGCPLSGELPLGWYAWPGKSTVHIATREFVPGRAVGTFMLQLSSLFTRSNIRNRLYAGAPCPQWRGAVSPSEELLHIVRPDDILLYNFHIQDPLLPELARLDCHKTALFHGLAPSSMFLAFDPEHARELDEAREQLSHLHGFDSLHAATRSAARTLARAECGAFDGGNEAADISTEQRVATNIIHALTPLALGEEPEDAPAGTGNGQCLHTACCQQPITVTMPFLGKRLAQGEIAPGLAIPRRFLLSTGPVSPHMRMHHVLALFACIAEKDRDMELVICGPPAIPGYSKYLNYLLDHAYRDLLDRIHLHESFDAPMLDALHGSCTGYLCLGEGEWCNLFLMDALDYDAPIFCSYSRSNREVLGEAGMQFPACDEHGDLEYQDIADSILTTLSEDGNRRRLRLARQKERASSPVSSASALNMLRMLEKLALFNDEE